MKRLSKNFIFKHLATFSFKIHILNSKPPSDKILSLISYHQMTKVFTRLQLKQILKQNLTNKILESKKSTPIQKRILPGIKILNIFYEKINWKLIFFLSTHGENLLKAPKKRHKNTVDIFFRGSNKFHKIHA